MNFKVIWILWKRDLLHYWRNRIRAVVGLTMPMLWLFVFGGGLSRSFNSDISYTQFIVNTELPRWMEILVRLNPASYAVDALRKIVLGGYDSFTLFGYHVTLWFDILLLIVFSIVLIGLAAQQFNRPK